ncbi:MAG: hypothetical protein QMC67_03960 [Candidatus Wallbacteria bacterium]
MDFIKKRTKNILISIIAFLLVSPGFIADYLFAQNNLVNEKTEEVKANKMPLPEPPVYGMPPTRFDHNMPGRNISVISARPKVKKSFSGIIVSAGSETPLPGMILEIQQLNSRTITSKTGAFKFQELYAEKDSDKFIMTITNSEDRSICRTMEIELTKSGSTIEVSL